MPNYCTDSPAITGSSRVEFRAEAVNRQRIDEPMKALGLDVTQ
jgi:hypothetical protein